MKYLIVLIAIAYATVSRADDAFREDVNADNRVNTADVVSIYNYILNGKASVLTCEMADVNGDDDVNSADVVRIYNSIISGQHIINDFKPNNEFACDTLLAGDILRLSEHYVRENSRIHAMVRTLDGTPINGAVYVGRGYEAWYGTYLKITHDTVQILRRSETEEIVDRTRAHGLDITDSLAVSICCDNDIGKITLSSGGRDFTMKCSWNGGSAPFVLNDTQQPMATTLRFSNPDYLYDIWLIGDSYLTRSVNRWIYYIYERGYTHWLSDHRAAATGEMALRFFKANLQMGTPRFALWLIGMNDGSDFDAPRSRWLSATKEFIAICEENGITPILQTFPNTFITSLQTLRRHQKKTEWIRSSGYRYIDLAAAIGSQPDGYWAEGMQGPDGIHPTPEGAQVMANQVLKDFPEIAE